jgi:hypothetical protein
MIQRIQSLYLLLTTLLSVLFLNGSVLCFVDKTGSSIKVNFTELTKSSGGQVPEVIEKLLPLSLIILLIAVISIVIIFLYKNRNIQLRLTFSLILLNVLLIIAFIHVSIRIISKFDAQLVPGIKMILPVLMLLFSILAYRGIKKDDRLVKSYDRLR